MLALQSKPILIKFGTTALIGLMLVVFAGFESKRSYESNVPLKPEQPLIRFHVLANSDSSEDQALKLAVRDRILNELSPRLAQSQSLEESRSLLQELRPEMERLAETVVQEQGYKYQVRTEFGQFMFPTKSYGSFVLPAGEYEALRVVIGEGQGANWWCVLFPPICFVDIENSTTVPVDGKAGVPLKKEQSGEMQGNKPVVKIWILEKTKEILKR